LLVVIYNYTNDARTHERQVVFVISYLMYFSYVPVLSVQLVFWLVCPHLNDSELNY